MQPGGLSCKEKRRGVTAIKKVVCATAPFKKKKTTNFWRADAKFIYFLWAFIFVICSLVRYSDAAPATEVCKYVHTYEVSEVWGYGWFGGVSICVSTVGYEN